MEIKHKGAYAEMKACAWLLEKGYIPFRNQSQHGDIDIIAYKEETGELIKIDVKYKNKHTVYSPGVDIKDQYKRGIHVLLYYADTDSFKFYKQDPTNVIAKNKIVTCEPRRPILSVRLSTWNETHNQLI